MSDRYSPRDIQDLLGPVATVPTIEFWRHQAQGLAILRSREHLEVFRVPLAMPELVVVAESFHVRPLLRCLRANERYFVIALTQNRVTVFEGALDSLSTLELPGLPAGLAKPESTRPALTAHPTRRGGSARHVHAGGTETGEEDLVSYFRAVDRAVARALRGDIAPVILAAVEYYVPLYRQASRLKQLASRSVAGSPDAMTLDELHARVLPVARELAREKEDRALEAFRRAAGRQRTSQKLEDIVARARQGSVRRLLLASDVRVWGRVDASTGRIHTTAEQRGSDDDDLLDDVAEDVFRHSGEVITLPADRMPDGAVVAAEWR